MHRPAEGSQGGVHLVADKVARRCDDLLSAFGLTNEGFELTIWGFQLTN